MRYGTCASCRLIVPFACMGGIERKAPLSCYCGQTDVQYYSPISVAERNSLLIDSGSWAHYNPRGAAEYALLTLQHSL